MVGLNEKAAEDVESYAGYISVFNTSNIFYWFIKAESDADTKPLIVWLQVIKHLFDRHVYRLHFAQNSTWVKNYKRHPNLVYKHVHYF